MTATGYVNLDKLIFSQGVLWKKLNNNSKLSIAATLARLRRIPHNFRASIINRHHKRTNQNPTAQILHREKIQIFSKNQIDELVSSDFYLCFYVYKTYKEHIYVAYPQRAFEERNFLNMFTLRR